jgi:hypothetical protein
MVKFQGLEAPLGVTNRSNNSPPIISGDGLSRLRIYSWSARNFSIQFQYWIARWFDWHGFEAIEPRSD